MAKQLPDLKFSQLINISFGFFGVQIAYALQSANISRIFATLGADPHSLSFFWLLPPIMGMIVQPLVGKYSDRTWTRYGRRIPYLFIGAIVAILVMCFLPNAGSLGLSVGQAMVFGAVMLMLPSSRSSATPVRWSASSSPSCSPPSASQALPPPASCPTR